MLYYFFNAIDIITNKGNTEIELITLVEEKIPKYKLRLDPLTQFTGKFTVFVYLLEMKAMHCLLSKVIVIMTGEL